MNARFLKGKEKYLAEKKTKELAEEAKKTKELIKKPIADPVKNTRTSLENTIGPKVKQNKTDDKKYSREIMMEERRQARINNMINNIDDMKASLAKKRRQTNLTSLTSKIAPGTQLSLFKGGGLIPKFQNGRPI